MGPRNDSLSFLDRDGKRAFIDCGPGHDVVNYLGPIDTRDVISTDCEEVNANTSDRPHPHRKIRVSGSDLRLGSFASYAAQGISRGTAAYIASASASDGDMAV